MLAVLLVVALQLSVTARAVPAADYQGTLQIGGTGAATGTITQVAAAFQKKHPDVRFVFPPSLGSSGGIKAVIAGALDVGLKAAPDRGGRPSLAKSGWNMPERRSSW